MNTKWFIVGFVIHQSTGAKINLISGHNTYKDYHEAEQAKQVAMGFGVLGGLLCLAGIAMPDEQKKSDSLDEWLDDDLDSDDDT